MKNKKIIISIVIGVVLLLGIGSFTFYQNGISAVSKKDEEVIVKIESGMNANNMLQQLNQAGLVKNALCGKIFLKLNNFDNLQENTYILNKNMSLKKIFGIIENPSYEYILKSTLTIKEGNTIPEVAKAYADILNLTSKEVIQAWANKSFLNKLINDYWFLDKTILNKDIMYPLEGYLYPETYYVTDDQQSLEDMTRLALDMMDKQLSAYKDQIKSMNWTPHQFLTFASIVERESLFDEDRPMIAGVFMNRLNSGMLLQSDITVNYALQRTGVDVSTKQLQVDSRYNTYKYTGLPIGPISTVSQTTIEACLNYTHHDYLYFFAKEDGTVLYSKTYEEHAKTVKENKWY